MSNIHHWKPPFQLLHPTKCYVDTISLFMPQRKLPQPSIIEELRAVNSGAVFPQKCVNRHSHWGWKLTVQAASESALFMLDHYQHRYKGKIVSLHIAIDLFTDPFENCFEDWLREHVVLKYRKPGPMLNRENTVSWVYHVGRRTPTKNIQLYSDRPSKLNNRLCNHLEVKLWRCRTIERLGLYRVRDVMQLDPTVLMPRLIRLWEPNEGGTPAQLLYDDPKERRGLKPISLDTLLLPQSFMFVRLQKYKVAA